MTKHQLLLVFRPKGNSESQVFSLSSLLWFNYKVSQWQEQLKLDQSYQCVHCLRKDGNDWKNEGISKFGKHSTDLVSSQNLPVVVGGGAAGIYGAIRAKTLAPDLNVVVKISGGGQCNVTNGHCADNLILADHYPRGCKELRGPFFSEHGPKDTMSWFTDHGVDLKTEDDGRVFPASNNSSSVVDCLLLEAKQMETEDDGRVIPASNNSSSVVDCLLLEAKQRGVLLQTGKVVTTASMTAGGKFLLKIEKLTVDSVEHVEANYLLIASGSSRQGYTLATQLGHSIIDPVPSLFTFKIEDPQLAELSGHWRMPRVQTGSVVIGPNGVVFQHEVEVVEGQVWARTVWVGSDEGVVSEGIGSLDLDEEERGVGEVTAVREGGEGEELAYGIGAAVAARGDEEGVGWEELVHVGAALCGEHAPVP
ncbi:hypothetical protein RHSIM_Rhsim10G0031600 [Rhododendron simsii]|uniref:RsdA/BaiN/AoA(So)-like Rossmann fold-like domain-containing protein n=1 Tax=Rhododendron simsii TaxID=118357 RepID=A0A834GA21_RHOSS|nr:hypothetical protein RHSIM_Rhsim10G0031600 [Rhododendron simsii]